MCKTLASFSLIFVFSCRKFKLPEGFELGSSESKAKMLTTRPPPCLVVTAPLGVEKVNFWLLWNLALKVAATSQISEVWSLASHYDVGKLVLDKHHWARMNREWVVYAELLLLLAWVLVAVLLLGEQTASIPAILWWFIAYQAGAVSGWLPQRSATCTIGNK